MLCGKFGFWAMFTRRVASMWWEEETWLYVFRMLLFYFLVYFVIFARRRPWHMIAARVPVLHSPPARHSSSPLFILDLFLVIPSFFPH